jgi:hypothetical protein
MPEWANTHAGGDPYLSASLFRREVRPDFPQAVDWFTRGCR